MLHAYLVLIGVWLLAVVLSLVHHIVRKRLPLTKNVPASARHPNWAHIVLADLLLYSLIPGVVLIFVFPFLPFAGFRAGLALGLVGIMLGGISAFASVVAGWEYPFPLAMCDGFFYVLKILACLGLLSALYPP